MIRNFNTFEGAFFILKNLFSKTSSYGEEDNENFINFTGDNSGIMLSNLELPFKGMTILMSFRIENLITCEKKNIYDKYLILSNEKQREAWISSRQNQGFMAHHQENFLDRNFTSNINFLDNNYLQQDNENKKINELKAYYPRIFSINVHNNYSIDLYIGYHENRRRLILEVFKII